MQPAVRSWPGSHLPSSTPEPGVCGCRPGRAHNRTPDRTTRCSETPRRWHRGPVGCRRPKTSSTHTGQEAEPRQPMRKPPPSRPDRGRCGVTPTAGPQARRAIPTVPRPHPPNPGPIRVPKSAPVFDWACSWPWKRSFRSCRSDRSGRRPGPWRRRPGNRHKARRPPVGDVGEGNRVPPVRCPVRRRSRRSGTPAPRRTRRR